GDRRRDERHPLRWIAGELAGPTRDRYERLLERTAAEVPPRTFDAAKFAPRRRLRGESVLLIDDTWTTGANAQSAAAALWALAPVVQVSSISRTDSPRSRRRGANFAASKVRGGTSAAVRSSNRSYRSRVGPASSPAIQRNGCRSSRRRSPEGTVVTTSNAALPVACDRQASWPVRKRHSTAA